MGVISNIAPNLLDATNNKITTPFSTFAVAIAICIILLNIFTGNQINITTKYCNTHCK